MAIKGILFNTDMVRAILDGRKTVTRRVIKPANRATAKVEGYYQGHGLWISDDTDNTDKRGHIKDYSVSSIWSGFAWYTKKYAPYHPGDYLYVRETWREYNGKYYYKSDEPPEYDSYFTKKLPCAPKWHPSIHMPKEAARIWLQVTDVRVERLRDITWEDGYREGLENPAKFSELWDSTVKKKDLPLYGWDASPWVWVIEFERTVKPKCI